MSTAALESAALRVEAEQIADAYQHREMRIGAPSTLGDPDKVQLLLASIRDGNYREVAIRQAGIAKQTFYNWLKRAEAGQSAPKAFVDALEKAEADAEAETVRNVRQASKLPQFWAAGMTYLERKHPDRWGRRQEDGAAPKVIVQIGARDSDVQVQVMTSPTFASDSQSLTDDLHSLSEAHASDNPDYVNLQPLDVTALSVIPHSGPITDGRAIRSGAPPSGAARSARTGGRQGKGRSGVGKEKKGKGEP